MECSLRRKLVEPVVSSQPKTMRVKRQVEVSVLNAPAMHSSQTVASCVTQATSPSQPL